MMYFKPLDKKHLEWARLLHNDPDVLGMLTDPRVVSQKEQKQWFKKLQKSSTSQRLLIMIAEVPIGLVRLDQIDTANQSVCIGLDIHRDYRGFGFARGAYKKLFKEWFHGRGFNRIWLMVADYNVRARKLYEKLGFKYEGVQRQALLKKGKFEDYHLMAILKEEWKDVD